MTAIGCIAEASQAVLWADTLYFVLGEPAGHRQKLVINEPARTAGCGTGASAICQAGRDAIAVAHDIHVLVDALPRTLAGAAAGVAADLAPGRGTFIVAGWSHRWRRVVAFAFEGPAFRAAPVPAFTSPYITDAATTVEATLDVVEGIARQQVLDLGRMHGCRITGEVTAATISRDGVAAHRLLDLGGRDAADDRGRRAAALVGAWHG